ncbi:uncharacterized protein LOC5500621 [Nematostella vectensis]|uniref:uncharacterized protein LOC5500621 n=1 Tax=Nematostella vectensis TaxID=45351 RepID=UPI00138FF026|nr:uncharacterized protein LOC5500621 [Nematostella vectensis]XP_032224913.1 uncharacterized protein LOC5500621 [Nematostella vectensis]XP_032224914.2 uncharacterized protein LOC5500621 [Nematostella vectensis]
MSVNAVRMPLLAEQHGSKSDDDENLQLSTFSEELGINEADGHSNKSQGSHQTPKSHENHPTIVLTEEQVDKLIDTLETTREALNHLSLRHNEFKPPRRPRVPVWITNHLFVITVVWQFMCIVALTVLQTFTHKLKGKEKLAFVLTITIMVLFQAVNLLLVFITSVKLTKQFLHHTVTRSFLGQSYLSMTLLFAGLYTLLYRIDKSSFKDLGGLGLQGDVLYSVILFIKMLFYSISIGTLCGAGHIVAATWYAQMITGLQMLMSYVYFASVLSITIHPPRKINHQMWRKGARTNRSYGAIKTV